MEFFVEQAVLDAGVKIVFAKVCGLDNHGEDPEWAAYRDKRLEELFEAYAELDVHADPILEGFNILHDKTGVKRRPGSSAARISRPARTSSSCSRRITVCSTSTRRWISIT